MEHVVLESFYNETVYHNICHGLPDTHFYHPRPPENSDPQATLNPKIYFAWELYSILTLNNNFEKVILISIIYIPCCIEIRQEVAIYNWIRIVGGNKYLTIYEGNINGDGG